MNVKKNTIHYKGVNKLVEVNMEVPQTMINTRVDKK